MQTLLIILLIGCALVGAVHIGRGMWARSRSVERHQQALHTLATFTAPAEGLAAARTEPGDHQAHVRVIGRSGRPGGNAAGASAATAGGHPARPGPGLGVPPAFPPRALGGGAGRGGHLGRAVGPGRAPGQAGQRSPTSRDAARPGPPGRHAAGDASGPRPRRPHDQARTRRPTAGVLLRRRHPGSRRQTPPGRTRRCRPSPGPVPAALGAPGPPPGAKTDSPPGPRRPGA